MEQEKEMENESTIDSSSQANVQALLALFGQKDQPLMGMLQPGCKFHSTSKMSLSSNSENCDNNNHNNDVQSSMTLEQARSTFLASQRKTSMPDVGISLNLSAANNRTATSVSPSQNVDNTVKPVLKPKPIIAQKPIKSLSANLLKLPKNEQSDGSLNESKENQSGSISSEETCDSEISSAGDSANQINANSRNSICVNKIFEKHPNIIGNNGGSQNSSPISWSLSISKFVFDECSLSTDNYICKNNKQFKRKELPLKDKLGPPPLKPVRPLNVKLVKPPLSMDCAPPLPDRTLKQIGLGSSASSLPPKPSRTAPAPPTCTQSTLKMHSDICEEKLNEDTRISNEGKQRPVSLIPEYTEEEELGDRESTDLEELYADGEAEAPLLPPNPLPARPNKPPPPVPGTSPEEEFYQDALELDQEEIYEEMPSDLHLDEQETPLYNNRKEQDKSRRDEEKKFRKEQEKREKELTKLRKKYALTGQEIPVDTGLVKTDSRGGWYDLSVRKGETVLILRMENNPSGKWLVKNEKGKIGYVELTNIEVDADSIKSVMSLRRTSSQSVSEDLYCDADTEEAIYEETY